MTRVFLAATLALGACVHRSSLDQELARISPTPSRPPVTVSDTVVALALAHAITEGIPDFSPSYRVVLQAEAWVSARALPASDNVSFYVLEYRRIQELAHRSEEFTYLGLAPPEIRGDTVQIGIGSTRAFRNRDLASGLSGGGCVWVFTRDSGRWRRSKVISCFIS
jgi:hypothetical protein